MSDDFDKEAEREKLRRQLEREEQAREATEHMSELLLKGATMTNRHCGECGDPIFRHDGQEFCPTCRRPVAETGTESGSNGEAEEAGEAAGTADADAGTAPDGTEPSPSAASAPAEGLDAVPDDDADARGAPDLDVEVPTADDGGSVSEPPDRSPARGREPTAPTSPRAGEDGDLDRARASLARTLTALAGEAEAAESVSRTRDLLAAAREAAEAIGAVDAARSGR